MNPADFGMFWMNQYAQADRMVMDDNTSYYAQPSIGMSVMDDISHQTNSMEMTPMGLINEYTAATAPGPIAITPDLFGGIPRTAATSSLRHHQLQQQQQQQQLPSQSYNEDQQHQTILDHYGALNNGIGTNDSDQQYEEDDDDDVDDVDDVDDNETQDNNLSHSSQVQHYDIGVGSDSVSLNQQFEDDNDEMTGTGGDDENSNDYMDQYDDDGDDGEGDGVDDEDIAQNNVYYQAVNSMVSATGDGGGSGAGTHVPYKKKTKSTQTNRKIKPVKRPGLVLKTPIAYQPCLDPSVIPIQRDGMAVCERCGAIGVKHSFYTKERRFCSMACARGDFLMMQMNDTNMSDSNISNDKTNNMEMTTNILDRDKTNTNVDIESHLNAAQLQNPNFRFKLSLNGGGVGDGTNRHTTNGKHGMYTDLGIDDRGNVLYHDLMPEDDLPQISKGNRLPSPCPQDEKIITVRRKPSEFLNSYDWSPQLSNANFFAAPVTCFSHAPGYDMWSNIGIEMKVEVENTDCDTQGLQQGLLPHSFWVATVLRLCGYKALLRYEGFDSDSSHDFWVNLCSSEVHPVGWCATRGKPLIPPRTIENKYGDWKDFLVKRLSGARTLPTTFYNKINESFKSRFRCGLQLEVVNKNRISQMRLATVHKIIGKRLLVRYFDAPEDNGFWVHEDSPLIHPVGWSINVGHNLSAPHEYLERMLAGREQALEVQDDDATMDLFKLNFTFEEYFLEGKTSGFLTGMKLEAVDPLNLSSICVATVMEVLKFGYMMIRIDSYDPDITGGDLFCYHEKSACIFPPGFCKSNDISLTPPKGYDSKSFSWKQYLLDTKSVPADEKLFYREATNNGFRPGMKIECADLMDPRLVCVATVAKTVGRLLKVHFDGWEDEYDQWLDAQSPDMYPVGWCILVGHKLEGPPLVPRIQVAQKISPKSVKRGKKKKGKADGKGKPRASTPTGIQIKHTAIKKEKDTIDQHKHSIEEKINGNRLKRSISSTRAIPKIEHSNEFDEDDDDVDDEDDEFSRDGYSHSVASMQSTSLPPTPEPRNVTPTQHNTRPSSKASTLSVTSHNSGAVTASPPPERKATSYINNTTATSGKLIPRLVETAVNNSSTSSHKNASSGKSEKNTNITQQTDKDLSPDTWNLYDVGQFLRVNDCTAHCETFNRHKVDGKRLLQLTKDEIVEMLNMKVGPALKIYDLIQQLKGKLKPLRLSTKTNVTKKFL